MTIWQWLRASLGDPQLVYRISVLGLLAVPLGLLYIFSVAR